MSDVSPRDHLANERTFLAWVRTSISLMAFGVVIAKLRFLLGESASGSASPNAGTHSTWLGLAFAGAGLVTLLFSAYHYERDRRALEANDYHSSPRIVYAFIVVIFLLGLAALFYLLSLPAH